MRIIVVILFSIVAFVIFYTIQVKQVNIKINELINQEKYKKAIFILRWKNSEKTIIDEHHKIIEIYGYVKDKTNITIKDKILTVTMSQYGAILKTKNDSIDINKNCTKVHGYMGTFTDSSNFYISKNGQINIIDFIPCK